MDNPLLLAAIARAAHAIYPHYMDDNKRQRVADALAELADVILVLAKETGNE